VRSFYLDVLRGVAILFVFGAHLDGFKDPNHLWTIPILNSWKLGGWQGVDLFFVVSGFLISGLLFKEHQLTGTIRAKHFLIRRGFKIYPMYYLFLAATPLIMWWDFKPIGYITEALFVQNYVYRIWGHTWSLAVEEHFYFSIALIFYFANKKLRDPFKYLPRIFFVVAFATLLMRYWTYIYIPFTNMTHRFATHLRIDSLGFGVLLAYYFHYYRAWMEAIVKKYQWLLLGLGLVTTLPNFLWPLFDSNLLPPLFFTLIYLGFGGILMVCVFKDSPNRLMEICLNPIRKIGFYSYSIYLWHMPVQYWSKHVFFKFTGYHVSPLGKVFVYVIGSVVFGVMMGKIIETPLLKVRDRFYPSKIKGARVV